jgi:hypothetical protein
MPSTQTLPLEDLIDLLKGEQRGSSLYLECLADFQERCKWGKVKLDVAHGVYRALYDGEIETLMLTFEKKELFTCHGQGWEDFVLASPEAIASDRVFGDLVKHYLFMTGRENEERFKHILAFIAWKVDPPVGNRENWQTENGQLVNPNDLKGPQRSLYETEKARFERAMAVWGF